jgi:hypothetical protein
MPDMVFDVPPRDYSANLVGVVMPARIRQLPVCPVRRVPVPWFVAKVNGIWEFRAADPEKLVLAVRNKLCWVCGAPLGRFMSFVLGPMCAVNRNSAEPSCHKECAVFSAQACPFLSKPRMHRREGGLPETLAESPGFAIKRNPGVACIWTTRGYETFRDKGGFLFTPGEPTTVEWFAEGRIATRAEVVESIDSGMPILMDSARAEDAEKQSDECVKYLHKLRADVEKYLP